MKRKITIFTLLIPLFLAAQEIKIENGPPYLQNVTENEATIIWTTNNTAVSWVEVAPGGGNDSFTLKSAINITKRHMAAGSPEPFTESPSTT